MNSWLKAASAWAVLGSLILMGVTNYMVGRARKYSGSRIPAMNADAKGWLLMAAASFSASAFCVACWWVTIAWG